VPSPKKCVGDSDVAKRRVADEDRQVEPRPPALQGVEILGEGLPLPVNPGAQRFRGHAFDVEQHAHQQLAIRRAAGRDAEAAVAHDHRGHAVPARGRQSTIPRHLAIVVRVQIDEPGGQREPAGIDRPPGRTVHFADLDDTSIVHRHVAAPGRRTAAITDVRTADDHIVHRSLLALI
jgi:hypothetical protein